MSERWGPLKPLNWPQNTLEVPGAGAAYMPPIQLENAQFAEREAFIFYGSISIPDATPTATVFNLFIATDQDGDFWCDQIYLTTFTGVPLVNGPPPPSLLRITDARTARQLCYPEGVSTEFLANRFSFQDKPVIDYSRAPLPDGFRSTATLPQPFCFTRQGGIEITLTMLSSTVGAGVAQTVDMAFSGWKEYANASA